MGFGNETTHQVEPTKGIQDIIVHKRRNFQANKLNSSNDNSKGHNKPIHHEARTQSFPPQNEGFHEESLHHLELHQEAHHPTHRHAAQDRLQHRTHESQAFTRNGQLLSQELISLRGTEQGFHGPTFKHNKGPWNYYNMPSRNHHNALEINCYARHTTTPTCQNIPILDIFLETRLPSRDDTESPLPRL
eukprot:GHVP01029956.1.p2 GENE.GHVP01029956.1~~GHVP01029956.1.p2  ORF type:complete len:189 (-),score=15.85 GHVP01029956.1:1000-1566(-)